MTALRTFLVLMILTGLLYPLSITGLAHLLYPLQANGSLVYQEGQAVGSHLIGQAFVSERYFWPRPSAIGYNPMPSGGSNLSPASKKFRAQLKPGSIDNLVMASGSGLDPEITVEAAQSQVDRIAKARQFNPAQYQALVTLIHTHTVHPTLEILGVNRVAVLDLNLALDQL